MDKKIQASRIVDKKIQASKIVQHMLLECGHEATRTLEDSRYKRPEGFVAQRIHLEDYVVCDRCIYRAERKRERLQAALRKLDFELGYAPEPVTSWGEKI